jgi:hypothetical protein
VDHSVIADVPRDKYVERCKQRALAYLQRGDLKSAISAFVNNMDARPDCELPHHLASGSTVTRYASFIYASHCGLQIDLSVDGFKTSKHCRVVLRNGNTCGAKFVDQSDARAARAAGS